MRHLIEIFVINSFLELRINIKEVIEGEKSKGRFCYHYTSPYILRFMSTQCRLYEDICRSEEQDCPIEDILI
jgi:hypothetical protein